MASVRLGLWLALACVLSSPSLVAAQTDDPLAAGARGAGLERREALPAPPADEVPLFVLNAAARGGVQWIVNPPRARDDVFGFGAVDFVLTARPTPEVTILVDVESLGGPGPDVALRSLTRVNAEAERLDGDDARVFLREAWIRVQSPGGAVRFNVGKLDVTHYFDRNFFAEDETRRFLNAALIGNPLLDPPVNGPGASIRVSQGEWRYAFGVQALDDFSGDHSGLPYLIGELGRRKIFPLDGHYRLWARGGSVTNRRQDLTWGTGVSIDQLVSDTTGIFVRAGASRRDGQGMTSHSWSAGLQHTPTWLGRPKDLAGIGYGVLRDGDGHEHAAEAYYNLSLAACCSVIANVERLRSRPTGHHHDERVVPGLRAVILY